MRVGRAACVLAGKLANSGLGEEYMVSCQKESMKRLVVGLDR